MALRSQRFTPVGRVSKLRVIEAGGVAPADAALMSNSRSANQATSRRRGRPRAQNPAFASTWSITSMLPSQIMLSAT